jgi:hypothetical protein
MLPPATISHRTHGRLRIRVASRKGDREFFSHLQQTLQKKMELQSIQTNALTGSVLILDPDIDVAVVSDQAAANNLFALQDRDPKKVPLAKSLMIPIQEADQKIKGFTGGEVDILGAIFILLCIYGLLEIFRGNAKSPPWYTAFWYAFGIFTKSMVDRSESAR